jgi:uncharacterized protein YndB with AHSA1/START domain
MKVTKSGEREILIERIFNAPRAAVWRAMTDPELVAQWWGRGHRLDVERFEFKVGGHWRFVEHADGQLQGFEGRFAEIVPQSRVAQTFEWDGLPGHVALDTMTLEDLGDGRTKVVSTSLFMTAEDRDGMIAAGMESGLRESYEALDRVLAKR